MSTPFHSVTKLYFSIQLLLNIHLKQFGYFVIRIPVHIFKKKVSTNVYKVH